VLWLLGILAADCGPAPDTVSAAAISLTLSASCTCIMVFVKRSPARARPACRTPAETVCHIDRQSLPFRSALTRALVSPAPARPLAGIWQPFCPHALVNDVSAARLVRAVCRSARNADCFERRVHGVVRRAEEDVAEGLRIGGDLESRVLAPLRLATVG
jgi:hypothetical protein